MRVNVTKMHYPLFLLWNMMFLTGIVRFTQIHLFSPQTNPLLLYEWKGVQLEPQFKNYLSAEFVFAVNCYVQQYRRP